MDTPHLARDATGRHQRGRWTVTMVCGLLLAMSFASAQQPPPRDTPVTTTRVVRGLVVDAATGAALPRARVMVGNTERRFDPTMTFTDDSGRFDLPTPSNNADITLVIGKGGYAASTVRVAAGQPPGDFRVVLTRGAAITGRVTDDIGVVVGATVAVRREDGAPGGGTGGPTTRTIQTNDIGEFRIGALPAGRYAVAVTQLPVRPGGAPAPPTRWSHEVALDLRPGDEVDIDLVVAGAPPVACGPSFTPPAPDPGATSLMRGRVVSATGQPLSCATVRVVQIGSDVRMTRTDRLGRFETAALRPGTYTVEAARDGYVTRQFGQVRSERSGTPITLREGEALDRVEVVLPRGSAITGTVVDEYGEPAEGVIVRALQLWSVDGRTVALPARGVRLQETDDRGRYRLFGLMPGIYLVNVITNPFVPTPAPQPQSGYAPIYYPGTPDIMGATRMTIEAGRDATGIDVIFAPSPAFTVTGRAFDSSGQPLSSRASVMLSVSQRSGNVPAEPVRVSVEADGTFTVPHVPPGDYVLHALSPTARTGIGELPHFGMEYVTVLNVDPPPVVIRTRPGATVEGRIRVEGSGDLAEGALALVVVPTDFDRSPLAGGGPGFTQVGQVNRVWQFNEAGSFRLSGVTGPRRIVLSSAPDDWYLKSAVVHGMDAADAPFDFGLEGGVFRDAEVVISTAGASVAGRVVDERDAPVADYTVVVFSTYPGHWFRASRHMKAVRPRADGTFQVTGLPPGEYWVAAIDQLAGADSATGSPLGLGEWQDTDVLGTVASRARRMSLAEGERLSLTLRLLRR